MLTYLLIIVGLFLIYWGFSWLWSYYQKSKFKAIGGEISPETFEHTMRKAQIIESRPYSGGTRFAIHPTAGTAR